MRQKAFGRLPCHSTGQGAASQMSAAYSAIVRSLENLPEQATLRIALRAQASASAIQLADPLLGLGVRRQVGQVHVVVASVSSVSRIGAKMPGSSRLK